jgi:sugar phosphate isomerase/epimerase
MDKKTFETLAQVDKLGEVVFSQVSESGFELLAFSAGYTGGPEFRTALGERRVWASLDTLFDFVRAMGYAGKIVIESDSGVFPARAGGQMERHKPPSFEKIEEGKQQAREAAKRLKEKLTKQQEEKEGEKPSRERERGG